MCMIFHKWGKWKKITATVRINWSLIEERLAQERVCEQCGLTQRRLI